MRITVIIIIITSNNIRIIISITNQINKKRINKDYLY